jgi:pyruvate/2-oxoacid:ferredoxin oxidoreductase beta subunit
MEEKTINETTWEELNPDWQEEGDLTPHFAKSQFDVCPGCGKFEQLEVMNTTYDDPGACVICRPCQFSAHGETPSEAIENWNRRYK